MSQLNLKQILSSDNLSVVVDSINFNFEQLVLNGGGPRGATGRIGPPGIPGQQGERGNTGATGATGTHVFAGAFDPNGGTVSLSPIPRFQDVFIEGEPDYINLWDYTGTGASAWNFIAKIQAPSGAWKNAPDFFTPGPTYTAIYNDFNLGSRLIFGPSAAIGPSAGVPFGGGAVGPILDYTNPLAPKINANLSTIAGPWAFADTVLTLASTQNQIRFVNPNVTGVGPAYSNFAVDGGGVMMSLSGLTAGATGDQLFSIFNADTLGNKSFSLRLNGSVNAVYADKSNRVLIGGPTVNLANALSVNGSVAIGATFYSSGTAGLPTPDSLAAAGRIAAGATATEVANLIAYGTHSGNGATVTSLVDVQGAVVNNTSATSVLRLTASKIDSSRTGATADIGYSWQMKSTKVQFFSLNWWTDGLTLKHKRWNLDSERDIAYFGSWNDFPTTLFGNAYYPRVGIGNVDPTAYFEVGDVWRIGMQPIPATSNTQYTDSGIGFNLSRIPLNNDYINKNDGANNGYAMITKNVDGGIGIIASHSTGAVSGTISESTVFSKQVFTVSADGYVQIAPGVFNGGQNADWGATVPLWVKHSATGASGTAQHSRILAVFGDNLGIAGAPIIQTLSQGLTQSDNASSWVKPQFSIWGSDLTGVFFNIGATGNYNDGNQPRVGFSNGGAERLTVAGARVGILQSNPLEVFQIGDWATYHDGEVKVWGHNFNYDYGIGGTRLQGSTATGQTQYGSFMQITSQNVPVNPIVAGRFESYGAVYQMEWYDIGAKGSTAGTISTSGSFGQMYRGIKFLPPAYTPTTSGWLNATTTPQVLFGLNYEYDNFNGGDLSAHKRGTLSIAGQARVKPDAGGFFGIGVEDMYNIGLYSFDGYAVGAIGAIGGNPNSNASKSLIFNLLSDDGLMRKDMSGLTIVSDDILLANANKRRAFFGSGVRVGIGYVPPITITTNDATLTIGVTGGATRALAANGDVAVSGNLYATVINGNAGSGLISLQGSVGVEVFAKNPGQPASYIVTANPASFTWSSTGGAFGTVKATKTGSFSGHMFTVQFPSVQYDRVIYWLGTGTLVGAIDWQLIWPGSVVISRSVCAAYAGGNFIIPSGVAVSFRVESNSGAVNFGGGGSYDFREMKLGL